MNGVLDEALALLTGAVVGLALGATGSGGSLLAIPLLVYGVGTSVQAATVLSLALVALSALIGAGEAFRDGAVRIKAGLMFGGTGLAGGAVGAMLHPLFRPEVLLISLGVIIVAAAGQMWRRSDRPVTDGPGESCADQFPRTCRIKAASLGFVVGVLTGLLGVGGGFVIVPALTLWLGFPVRIAVGTSLFVIALVAAGGLAAHLRGVGMERALFLPLALGGVSGMAGGRLFARLVSQRTLTKTYARLALAVATVLITDNTLKLLGEAS